MVKADKAFTASMNLTQFCSLKSKNSIVRVDFVKTQIGNRSTSLPTMPASSPTQPNTLLI
ncbi:hypothetical protein LCAZH_0545 [Lacticaseibacillus paracasei]|nr:hypothetical protein LCAZH_0545 [Lacticaseibacillus paracasei]